VRLKAGTLGPVKVSVHGLAVECFSLHCAIATILSITLPYEGDTGDIVDYAHALVVILSRWFHALTPHKAPTCVTVMFRLREEDGVVLLPELEDAVFALGSTKTASGVSNAQRNQWRKSRSDLLSTVLGPNSPFPTKVRLSQLENLRRTCTGIQLEQLNRFSSRIDQRTSMEVKQNFGDCAETVPLAIMANVPGGGAVVTISVVTNLVNDIRPLLNVSEITSKVDIHPPCLNCKFAFARAEVSGTRVLEVCELEPAIRDGTYMWHLDYFQESPIESHTGQESLDRMTVKGDQINMNTRTDVTGSANCEKPSNKAVKGTEETPREG
jgi:hypothetical protein